MLTENRLSSMPTSTVPMWYSFTKVKCFYDKAKAKDEEVKSDARTD